MREFFLLRDFFIPEGNDWIRKIRMYEFSEAAKAYIHTIFFRGRIV